ncbi:MAG: GTPase HflX [Deltaproteobacteria bacterium RIFOXYA12_FULL_58_15]|nr:MAG: GTPase HflX [Deltaproteobacteria bacterium RIFOXYA12_FULL_58_15]OGR07811.1 MAG: GTPase HflX [Deltaproteobacteria bacterium RIFOXYB12_FULL_58_9]
MSEPTQPLRAVLVGIQTPDMTDEQLTRSLTELGRLAETLGVRVIEQVRQKRECIDAGVLGQGKRMELARLTGGSGIVARGPLAQRKKVDAEADDAMKEYLADHGEPDEIANLVIVDGELTPTQIRDLSTAVGVEVTDRTGIIVDIFHRHASTREARLQVEIARLKYLAPRMRAAGGPSERQAGKGTGESNLELDRRKIRDRIAELRKELKAIESESNVRAARRQDTLRVALVGYTNAGKSSWMRELTHSTVLVEDKLFATLDTTVRALFPAVVPQILVSDTVGFIQRLPHDLVASFRSTLSEAKDAGLLLHVADASDPDLEAQIQLTREVLAEIGVRDGNSILVLNKIDCCDAERCHELAARYPDALLVSVNRPQHVEKVHQVIVGEFERLLEDLALVVPYAQTSMIGEVHKRARVVNETFEDDGVHYQLKVTATDATRLLRMLSST